MLRFVWDLLEAAEALPVGNVLNVLGLALTVFFAGGAWRAADAARAASELAAKKFARSNYRFQIMEARAYADELAQFIERDTWELAADRAYRLVNSLAPLISDHRNPMSEESRAKFMTSAEQLRSVRTVSLKAKSGRISAREKNRSIKIVDEHRELVIVELEALKYEDG